MFLQTSFIECNVWPSKATIVIAMIYLHSKKLIYRLGIPFLSSLIAVKALCLGFYWLFACCCRRQSNEPIKFAKILTQIEKNGTAKHIIFYLRSVLRLFAFKCVEKNLASCKNVEELGKCKLLQELCQATGCVQTALLYYVIVGLWERILCAKRA